MSEDDGSQFVGIDLHRRRSVIVRTTGAGEALEVVRITNDLDSLAAVMARAGEAPQVVLEASYGWYWGSMPCRPVGRRSISRTRCGEGFRVPAGEERRSGCQRPGRPAADGMPSGSVDRAAGHP